MMGIIRKLVFSSLFVCIGMPVSYADVFKYKDAKGNYIFTDHKLKRSYQLVWRSSDIWSKKKRVGKTRFNLAAYRKNKLRYSGLINQAAKKAGIKPALLHALVRAESSYDAHALSSAGAMGLAQLMPATAKRYGVTNITDPKQNVEAGARYLKDLLRMFKNNKRLALAGYNAGENAVKRYGNKIPPYPETRKYVTKVMKFYRENQKINVASTDGIRWSQATTRVRTTVAKLSNNEVPMLVTSNSGKQAIWTKVKLVD